MQYRGLWIGFTAVIVVSFVLQTWASVEHGLWYARSADFLQTDAMIVLRWLRVVGDTVFAVGIMGLGWFVVGLKTGWSVSEEKDVVLSTASSMDARTERSPL